MKSSGENFVLRGKERSTYLKSSSLIVPYLIKFKYRALSQDGFGLKDYMETDRGGASERR